MPRDGGGLGLATPSRSLAHFCQEVWIIPTSYRRHLRFKEVGQFKQSHPAGQGQSRIPTSKFSLGLTLASPHFVTCEGPELLASSDTGRPAGTGREDGVVPRAKSPAGRPG